MKPYEGSVVFIEGRPFGIARRVSTNVKLFPQDTGRWSIGLANRPSHGAVASKNAQAHWS